MLKSKSIYLACVLAGTFCLNLAGAETVTQSVKTNVVDTKITAAVKAKILAANTKSELVGKNSVSVKTVNQVVRLTGCTSNKEDKAAIENLAKNTDDVTSVTNKLTVRSNCE